MMLSPLWPTVAVSVLIVTTGSSMLGEYLRDTAKPTTKPIANIISKINAPVLYFMHMSLQVSDSRSIGRALRLTGGVVFFMFLAFSSAA